MLASQVRRKFQPFLSDGSEPRERVLSARVREHVRVLAWCSRARVKGSSMSQLAQLSFHAPP